MQIVKSNRVTNHIFKHISEFKNNQEQIKIIEDSRILNLEIAESRAKAEFIKNGHKIDSITISTHYIPNLQIKDVIEVNSPIYNISSRFLVQEIKTKVERVEGRATTFLQDIRAVRYIEID